MPGSSLYSLSLLNYPLPLANRVMSARCSSRKTGTRLSPSKPIHDSVMEYGFQGQGQYPGIIRLTHHHKSLIHKGKISPLMGCSTSHRDRAGADRGSGFITRESGNSENPQSNQILALTWQQSSGSLTRCLHFRKVWLTCPRVACRRWSGGKSPACWNIWPSRCVDQSP
jgi:hypothetical protein